MAELFKPQSPAFTQLWETPEIPGSSLGDLELEGGERVKVADMEYWQKPLSDAGFDVQADMMRDTGTGIITDDPTEPIYGNQYLPRKFKTAVTVPGDNSIDIYTNDIGLVVIVDPNDPEELLGFNVMVGGGMGRTHNKDTTFARTADHLGFVSKGDMTELMKSILATQRDHGNRDVRPNARMKYLVYEKGIEKFRELVETYFGKKIEKWRDLPEWQYHDWMGWHDQGDDKLFLGVNIEQGRVRDNMGPGGNVHYKKAFRELVDKHDLTMILSPTQSVVFRDISPADKDSVDAILRANNVPQVEDIDSLVRGSIACPAFPMCGLAVAEAERRMPDLNSMVRILFYVLPFFSCS
jgi:sulfite reductase (ferredoxin)